MTKIKKYTFHLWDGRFVSAADINFFTATCFSKNVNDIYFSLLNYFDNVVSVEILKNRYNVKLFFNTLNERVKVATFIPVY